MSDILTPDCPECGHPPIFALSAQQAFCGRHDCMAFCWDMTITKARNIAGRSELDLSFLDNIAPARNEDDDQTPST